jgi:hypothetical protein
MLPNRVCLRLASGRLLPATATGQANFTSLAQWVPVPDTLEGRLLGLEDNGRPLGTHPAVWYGWPRKREDIRDVWQVSDGNETREVRAYNLELAVRESGFARENVQTVLMKRRWY